MKSSAINRFSWCLFAGVLLASCKKELNQTPYDSTVVTTAIKNEIDLNAAVNGVYSSLRTTDLYGRTLIMKGDLMSDNAFQSTANSGRYTNFNQYTITVTDGNAAGAWANAYAAIKNANVIINTDLVNNNDNISQLLSETYAVRGMVYFDLARNFARPYTADPNAPGVPIVLAFDQSIKPARNTIKEVYTQALADLNKAYTLAKFNQGTTMTFISTGSTRSVNSSFISKYAIKGLLAKVYQHMGDWTNARDAALDVVTNGGFTLSTSGSLLSYWKGASPLTSKMETMFELTSDANNSVGDGTLADLYVPKSLGGTYGDFLCVQELYDSYSATDARKGLYTVSTRSGQLGNAIYVNKYPIDKTNYDDIKIVRYADVLLILAEACYNLADEPNARKYVNMVAQQRDPSFTGYISTGSPLLEDILTERRKELAFEGYRFWDLYRLKRNFTKIVNQNPASSVSVTPITTNIVFPIPNDELLVNATLRSQQNSGY